MKETSRTKEEYRNIYLNDKTILWSGNPKPKFKFTVLAGGFYNIPLGGYWVILCVFTLMFLTIAIQESQFWTIFFSISLSILLLIPDIIKWVSIKSTTYYITKEYIGFNFGKKSNDLVKIKDIKYIETETDNEGKLIIFFLTKGKLSFKTYNLLNLEPRSFLTFEALENGIEAQNILERLLLKRRLIEDGDLLEIE